MARPNQELNIELEVNLDLQDAYSLVEKTYLWQQKWNTCVTESFYRQLVPTVSNNIKYTNAVRRKSVVATRLKLGKCKLISYLYTKKTVKEMIYVVYVMYQKQQNTIF